MKLPKQKGKPALRPMAQAIQAAMKQRGMGVPELTETLGLAVEQRGAVANWVVGKNGPGPQIRPRLAEVLGMDEASLIAPGGVPGRKTAIKLGPAQRAVALVEVAKSNGQLLPPAPPVTDVFSIRARSDGNMIVKLEANLPFAKGAQLVQFLMTFGLAPGAEEPS